MIYFVNGSTNDTGKYINPRTGKKRQSGNPIVGGEVSIWEILVSLLTI